MDAESAIKRAIAEFEQALVHLKNEFAKLQVGRAHPALVENVPVNVYGSVQPVKAIASITTPDPRSLYIQPWDKGSITAIEKAISDMGLGLNPSNDGNGIRIIIPSLTEERRAELSRHVGKLAEQGRIAVRSSRQDAHNHFRTLKEKKELTDDDVHLYEKRLQAKVDETNKTIETLAETKEKDIMTV